MERTVRGGLWGVITPVAVALISTVFWGLFFQPDPKIPVIAVGCVFAFIGSITISALAALFFGVPTYLAFEKLKVRSAKAYLVWGIVVSSLIGICLVYPVGPENAAQKSSSLLVLAVSLLSGPSASVVFWKIVRPDLRTE